MAQIINFTFNGNVYYTKRAITLFDLIIYFNYSDALIVLEHNNLICTKKKWKHTLIQNHDQIEMVTIVGGG